MKRSTLVLPLVIGILLMTGMIASAEEAMSATEAVPYSVKVQEFHGCECESVCPCPFSKDATYGMCRAVIAFTFNGTYGSTTLKNASCVTVGTNLGKNAEDNMGNWEGILYTSDKATPAEVDAIKGLLHIMMGNVFAKLDEKQETITIQSEGDMHELTLGDVAHLRIHGLKGYNGKITKISNAPSPVAFPEYYCAIADEHTYDDGTTSWSFNGRNAAFAEFDLVSK